MVEHEVHGATGRYRPFLHVTDSSDPEAPEFSSPLGLLTSAPPGCWRWVECCACCLLPRGISRRGRRRHRRSVHDLSSARRTPTFTRLERRQKIMPHGRCMGGVSTCTISSSSSCDSLSFLTESLMRLGCCSEPELKYTVPWMVGVPIGEASSDAFIFRWNSSWQ